jgi:2'-phosphotransferase
MIKTPYCGIVLFLNNDVVLVKTYNGHYGFPKGRRKKGETDLENALREVEEKSNVKLKDMKLYKHDNGDYVTINEIKNTDPSIIYFVAELNNKVNLRLKIEEPEELDEVTYVSISTALAFSEWDLVERRKIVLRDAVMLKQVNQSTMNSSDLKYLSKALSWVLRHGIIKSNLQDVMTGDGYVPVDRFLSLKQFKGFGINQIIYTVENNDKNRFSIVTKNGVEMIRANQGHCLEIGLLLNDDTMMELITDPFHICVHGTTRKAIAEIEKSGLKPMGRKHVHLAIGLPGDNNVISGMRKTSKVLVYIDMKKAMDNGKKFYLSENNVILCPTTIESRYFEKVEIN